MITTLDEAIAHAKEVAKELKSSLSDYPRDCFTQSEIDEIVRQVQEHEQLAAWLEELAERREADRWIPVSERLPETTSLILLSVKHETPTRTHNAVYGGYYDRKFLTVNNMEVEGCFVEGCITKVEAWKPLPKPYESEDSE